MLVLRRSRFGAAAGVVFGLVVASAPSAWAHIDPDPATAPAGARQTIGFTVEHGCNDTSATTAADMRLPDGVLDVAASGPNGWTATVAGGVVSWVGPAIAPDAEFELRIEVTLPATPGAKLYFPFVQRCETGETRWIGTDEAPSDEPAPAMTLTEAVPGAEPPTTQVTTTSSPADEVATSALSAASTIAEPASSAVAAETAASATDVATSETPVAASTASAAPSPTEGRAVEADETSGVNLAWLVVVLGAAVVGAALFVVRRRR